MSYTLEDDNGVAVLRTQERPIEVFIKNFTDNPAKPRLVVRSTVKTFILDPAVNPVGMLNAVNIASYEPNRIRLVVCVLDAPVTILTEVPRITPDIASIAAGPAPEGRVLMNGLIEYVFYGPDEFYLNTLTGATASRVTVTKEYAAS